MSDWDIYALQNDIRELKERVSNLENKSQSPAPVIQCKKPAVWIPLEDLFKEAVELLKTFDNLNFAEQSEEFQMHCYELHKFLEKVGAVDE